MSPRQRLQAVGLFGAITAMALLQVAGIASIGPFLALVSDPSVIEANSLLRWTFHTFGFESVTGFLVFVGIAVLAVFTFSNLFAMFTTWLLLRFSWNFSYTLSRTLLRHYLQMPYSFFLRRNTSELSKNVLAEAREVVSGIMVPGMQAVSRTMAAIAIVILLVVIDPFLALATTTVLGGTYLIIYGLVRKRLARTGEGRFSANKAQYQAAGEALGGIKEVKLLGSEPVLLSRYAGAAKSYAGFRAANDIISRLPHYVVEILAFGGLLLIVLYLLIARGDLSQVVPIVGLYAFASYRLLPAIKEIFTGVTKVRYSLPSLDHITADLAKTAMAQSVQRRLLQPLPLRREITLRGITFRYPGSEEPVLKEIDLRVQASTSVALVGATGSGKTTTADIILGLLEPTTGKLLVDDQPVTPDNVRNWQKNLGYVPQHIYLSDDTIAHNIAFGVPYEDVDMAAVERAAKVANIHDFTVSELPNGYDTVVGERGVRLSGGQRQRVGIARALYHDPSVLVLDEATSALDNVTEENVFAEVQRAATTKTVVMIAHRLSTVRDCDVIYVLDKGRVVAQGTFDHLMKSSNEFRAMARRGTADHSSEPLEVGASS